MKKLVALVGLGIAAILPFSVRATGGKVNWVCPDTCTVAGGDKCQTTCKLSLEADAEITVGEISGSLVTGEGITRTEIKLADGWTKTEVGNDFTFKADPAKKGKNIDIASITFEYAQGTDCSIKFKSEMFKVAEKKLPKEENAKTGATLPIVLLVSAVGVAGVFYYVSKKNTKMHEI